MTEWQWKVVIALCKCVLHLFMYCDVETSPELKILSDAVNREK